jgi:hypothetical protein
MTQDGSGRSSRTTINTKKWYRKKADLWAELGDEIPFG